MTKNVDYLTSLRNLGFYKEKNLSDKMGNCTKSETISMSKKKMEKHKTFSINIKI